MKTKALRALLSLSLCAAILWVAYHLLFKWSNDKTGRDTIVALYGSLNMGMSPASVRDIYHGARYSSLRLYELSATNWVVQSPISVGAVNWNLWLDFNTAGLVAVKVRLADSRYAHPKSAPPDKVYR
jgi:hypothetical protein